MNSTLKLWTTLGLGTALAGGLLSACGGEAGGGAKTEAAAPGEAGGEGEGGAGGEGEGGETAGGEGEGGVAVADAATDPVAYLTALAVTQAHVVAARDAYAAGRKDAAAEMFAHPASEVLVEMDPVFAKLGVADFKPLLVTASSAASQGKSVTDVNQAYEDIIAALQVAAAKAPDSKASDGTIALALVADQIERATTMYLTLGKDGREETYLDGYGFARVAEKWGTDYGPEIKAENSSAYARVTEALALLKKAYPAAIRPAKLPVEPGALSAASSKVMLAAGS